MRWCELVLQRLCEGVRSLKAQIQNHEKGEKVTLNLKGCTLLFEVFYVEHIDCGILKTPVGERTSPRLGDWTDGRISKVYRKVKSFVNATVKLFHCLAQCGVPLSSGPNPIGQNENTKPKERLKNFEGVVPPLKEAMTLNSQKVELLLQKVEELSRTVLALQIEVSTLRGLVKKLEEKLEDKEANEKGDSVGPTQDVNANIDHFMSTPTLMTFSENDVPSPSACTNDKDAEKVIGKELEWTQNCASPERLQSPMVEEFSLAIFDAQVVPSLSYEVDEVPEYVGIV